MSGCVLATIDPATGDERAFADFGQSPFGGVYYTSPPFVAGTVCAIDRLIADARP